MRKRRIGPLPLTGGLQLSAPEGKPTGLLRALNVEQRDGYLQRRRGSEVLAVAWKYDEETATSVHEAFAGKSVTYVQVPDNIPAGQMFVFVLLAWVPAVAEVIDGTVTWEFFGEDDAWHELDVCNITERRTGAFFHTAIIGTDSDVDQYGAIFAASYPHGFKTAQPTPTGSSARWLRMTRSSGTWTTNIEYSNTRDYGFSFEQFRGAMICPTTRTGRGPFFFMRDKAAESKLSMAEATRYVDGYFIDTLYGTPLDASRPPVLLYLPATDSLLFSESDGLQVYDLSSGGIFASEFTPEAPDPETSAYGDITCRSALPQYPAAYCIHKGRVFLAAFNGDKTRIIWSAPEAYWTIWPESNDARLPSAGGGEILALVSHDDQVFIFTSDGIWRGTLEDPVGNSESSMLLEFVEEVTVLGGGTVVQTPHGICFLSADGLRLFDGQRSAPLMKHVAHLFRHDSDHPFTVRHTRCAVAAWNPIDDAYLMAYGSSGVGQNDTLMKVDLKTRACWLHGAEIPTGADASGEGTADEPIGQRPCGQQWVALAWDSRTARMLGVTATDELCVLDSGEQDIGHRIPWFAESHSLRIAAAEQAVCEQVELAVARDHFQPVKVSVIPDGDRARADSKDIAAQRDRLDTAATIDGASLAGSITPLQLDESIAPLVWRGRKKARNHRVRVEGIAPTHRPVRIVALTATLSVDERSR